MKKLSLIMALSMIVGAAGAGIVFQDDFEDGIDTGADWNPKWQSGSDQQNLFNSDPGGYATLDTATAIRNYHIDTKHGFSVSGTDYATMTMDMRYVHNGLGNGLQANKVFIALQFNETPTWWDGNVETKGVVNRNDAIGLIHPASPWVEGWITHSSLGVNTTAGTSQTSSWVVVQSTISVSGGNYWLDTDLYAADGTTLLYDGTSFDTGEAAGTTIYAGLTTAWQDSTNRIETITNIEEVHIDNFIVETIPEPATFGLIAAFGGAALFIRRRFMK